VEGSFLLTHFLCFPLAGVTGLIAGHPFDTVKVYFDMHNLYKGHTWPFDDFFVYASK
jgi:hypothetical protein